jgi:site-specific recombinase XerD
MVGTLLSTSLAAGGTLDEIRDLLGHAAITSSQVYLHPSPDRLRAAVDRVDVPRATTTQASR